MNKPKFENQLLIWIQKLREGTHKCLENETRFHLSNYQTISLLFSKIKPFTLDICSEVVRNFETFFSKIPFDLKFAGDHYSHYMIFILLEEGPEYPMESFSKHKKILDHIIILIIFCFWKEIWNIFSNFCKNDF